MTREEVRKLMHDYFDDLLSPEVRSSVESYLEEYDDVSSEYNLFEKLLEKSQSLPIGIKTPDTVMEKISDELLSKSLQQIESDKQKRLRELTERTKKDGEKGKQTKSKVDKRKTAGGYPEEKSKRGFSKVPLIIILVLVLCVGGYFTYDYFKTNLPWKLKAEYGQYQIGPNISNKKTLDEHQILSTLDSSRVSVFASGAGSFDLRSYSSIELIKGKNNDNIISLLSGKIEVESKLDKPSLIIKTAPVDLIAEGGNFSVMIAPKGDVNVQTGNGIVELQNSREQLTLIQDHKCKILSDGNIGIPYHINANPELVELVLQASFEGDQVVNLEQLLNLSTPLDGMTLLYLIKDLRNPSDRLSVFLKLNEFYPIPPGITQAGIINLRPDMFEKWREDIEWQI